MHPLAPGSFMPQPRMGPRSVSEEEFNVPRQVSLQKSAAGLGFNIVGGEDGEGAEHVVGRDELRALAEHDEGEAEGDAEAREDEVVDARGRAPAAADLAGHHDAKT